MAAEAERGRVIAAHGRHYTVRMSDGAERTGFPRGKKGGVAVGDYVRILPQGRHEGQILEVIDRRNLLYRSDQSRSKLFAANVDQLLIVVAVEPAFSDDLLGRALVAARSADIDPLIVLNKSDLASDRVDDLRQRLQHASASDAADSTPAPIVALSALDAAGTAQALLPYLRDRCSLLLGQSGMGKSTLLNALVPQAQAATQSHSIALDAGRHTTTSTRLYALPGGGELIDSPGFQSFGLHHLTPGEIERGFPEFAPHVGQCRFYNCTHRNEPGCGVLQAMERGELAPQRHALYVRILQENEAAQRY